VEVDSGRGLGRLPPFYTTWLTPKLTLTVKLQATFQIKSQICRSYLDTSTGLTTLGMVSQYTPPLPRVYPRVF